MRILAAFLCLFLLLAALSYSASTQKIDPALYESQDDKVTVIVKADDNYNIEGAENVKQFRQTNFYTARIRKSMLNALENDPVVEKVWANGEKKILLDVSVPIINASTAWGTGYNGSGIRICVLDTGVDKTHPSLADRVVNEADFTGGGNPQDIYGHGTHVAGIAAGNDAVFRGVAFGAGILNAKVCDDAGRCLDTDILRGVDWCVDNGAHILTLSLGGREIPADGSDVLSSYLDNIADKGKVVTVAAGNSGPSGEDNCRTIDSTGNSFSICSPGLAHKVITVGSTDTGKGSTTRDAVSGFSSRGPTDDSRIKPDVLAPGNPIASANSRWETQDDFVQKSGTSMSTPHIAGIAALMLQARDNLTPAEVKAIMMNSALDLNGNFSKTSDKGAGRIDVSRIFGEINNTISGTISNIGKIHSIFVPVNSSEIRATVYWSENYSVHQNLDLQLLDPSGAIVKSSASVLQTEEMIKVTNPVSGYWNILVLPTTVSGSAKYSIASNFLPFGEVFFTNNTLGGISYYRINTTNNSLLSMSIGWIDNASIQLGLYNTSGNSVFSTSRTNHINVSINASAGMWTARLVPSSLSANTAYNITSSFTLSDKFVDNISPSVDLTGPVNNSFLNKNNIIVNFTAIDDLNLEQECSRNLNGTKINLGNATSGVQNSYILNLSDGTYPLNVTCSDQSRNNATSQTVIFTIDTVKPTISIVSADVNNSFVSRNYIFINVSVSDLTNISACILEWNGTNQTMVKLNNGTLVSCTANKTADDGTYNYRIHANDSAGNTATETLNITLDTRPPVILALSPANNTFMRGLNENFSLSYSEMHLRRANLYWGAAQNFTNTSMACLSGTRNCSILINLTSLQHNTTISFYFETTDLAGNTANSFMMSASIDRIPPDAGFVSPTPLNGTTHETSRITINMTASEPLSSAVLELNFVNESMSGGGKEWAKTLDLSDGNYTLKAYLADLAGNFNATQEVLVFIKARENVTSYFGSLSASLSARNITMTFLETDNEISVSALDAAKNYTLRFNLTGTLIEIVDFNLSALNLSNMMGIADDIEGAGSVSSAFSQSGGVFGSLAWVDMNGALPENSYAAKITFPQVYAIYFYLNGTRDAPDITRIESACNADFTNKPCYNMTTNASVLYLPSFSGAAAGNDTQAPNVTITSPVASTTYASSSIPLNYTASDNIAADGCVYRLNNDSNVSLIGCTNTTITASQGSNTLVLYANDTSGNEIKNTIAFTFTPPASPSPSASGGGYSGGGGGARPAPQAKPNLTNASLSNATPNVAHKSAANITGNGAPATNKTNVMPASQALANETAAEKNQTGVIGPTGLVAASPTSLAVAGVVILAGMLVFFRLKKKPKRKIRKKQKGVILGEAKLLRDLRKNKVFSRFQNALHFENSKKLRFLRKYRYRRHS
ncbi:MAG: S8 family peptidase [Candidatus Aenigmarchaeota archaeon]|nr:S8 family peptidase [Candidatus Aenigmarchaeota archaeon]